MKIWKLTISDSRGLHAETCARIVRIAERCRCNLSLVAKGRRVSARNIVAVMLLTASMGVTVRIEASGPDEEVAIREIATLFQDGRGERR
jgi:phosphocarrier protein HPr